MRILVLGAGGTGGYFGGRLAAAGADVTFLVRERRLTQLQRDGLRIESPLGDATVPVRAVPRPEPSRRYDLVLLTCKAYDLADAMASIGAAMEGGAAVLPILNGIAHLQRLNERFGAGHVLGGTAKIQATLGPDGVIRHLNDWCSLTFGEQDGAGTARCRALLDAFAGTGVDARLSGDIRRELWLKLVHLATVAALTVVLRANVGEIVRTPEGGALFQRLLDLHAGIAAREGFPPDEAFLASYRALFSDPASTYEASLLRDLEQGRPIEGDHILGFMLERCRAHGLPDEILSLAWTHARAYEQRRAAGRLPGAA